MHNGFTVAERKTEKETETHDGFLMIVVCFNLIFQTNFLLMMSTKIEEKESMIPMTIKKKNNKFLLGLNETVATHMLRREQSHQLAQWIFLQA